MKQTNGTEKVLSEEEYDYREVSGDATSAWEYLDSCSDGEIVALAAYARRQASESSQTRQKAIILPVLQDFAKKNTARLKVTDYEDSLHAELDLEVSFVLDADDTAMRTVLMLAKGICMESRKDAPGILHIELDYE